MTPDFYDRSFERDNDLVQGLCHNARNTHRDLREWIEAELKALIFEAEIQMPLVDGPLSDSLRGAVQKLRTISQNDLPEAYTKYNNLIRDVSEGGFTSVDDAYDQIQIGFTPLVRMMKELQQVREFIGETGGN